MNTRYVRFRGQAAIILALALLLGIAPTVQAAPGDLDPTFDGDGKVTTDFAGGPDYGTDLALDSMGRLVIAGYSGPFGGGADFALARYNPNGSLDTSFDGDGKVKTDFNGADDLGLGIAIDTTGRIVVVGRIGNAYPNFDIGLARYNPDGSLDSAFGTGGKVITDFEGTYATGSAVALDSTGRIVVVGQTRVSQGFTCAVLRYDMNGSLDPTFGSGGKIAPLNLTSACNSVTFDATDRLLVVGPGGATPDTRFLVARLDTDGTPDSTFGFNSWGWVVTDFTSGYDIGRHVMVDGLGNIIVAGSAGGTPTGTDNDSDFAVARYIPDGSLDTTFDGDGKLVTDFAGYRDEGKAAALDSAGRITVGGRARSAPDSYEFAVVRYNPDGTLDSSFGLAGKVMTGFAGGQALGSDMKLDGLGRIIVAGAIEVGATNADFAVARYLSDEPPRSIYMPLIRRT